ncbi:hypothetical protein VII00023_13227 [Vibrio ichthyoenteri ATCC 700023]|uniref:Lipoprotein n=1 Tax=Vibrio ichthyoenteri ATCC 700023 TaxID=870968 RepID=F9S560_9VIBR|nr:DUF2799 domain-containing protein [Vibrio ichthyoenteri]EGU36138.1 hypothetical protein VII00023_13227 [Vibrio ichthyoenteri ATCC 700023]
MKWKVMLMCSVLMGCAAQPISIPNTTEAWQDYGRQQAIKGHQLQSEQKLAELDQSGVFTDELFEAYQAGYAVGKEKYCSQSAYMLGRIGQPYLGICDDVDPFFRSDYNNGRNESW